MQDEILNTPNLTVRAAPVEDLIIQGEDAAEMDGCHGEKPVCSGVVLGKYRVTLLKRCFLKTSEI